MWRCRSVRPTTQARRMPHAHLSRATCRTAAQVCAELHEVSRFPSASSRQRAHLSDSRRLSRSLSASRRPESRSPSAGREAREAYPPCSSRLRSTSFSSLYFSCARTHDLQRMIQPHVQWWPTLRCVNRGDANVSASCCPACPAGADDAWMSECLFCPACCRKEWQ